MSTNSTIAIQNLDGTVSQIYCHWDGYVSYNGRMLKQFYNTPELVKQLVSLGDLSALKERIEPTSEYAHSFDYPEDGTCIYYGRDRGESNTEVKIFDSFVDYRLKYQREEINYIFTEDESKWYIVYKNGTLVEFLPELDITEEEIKNG